MNAEILGHARMEVRSASARARNAPWRPLAQAMELYALALLVAISGGWFLFFSVDDSSGALTGAIFGCFSAYAVARGLAYCGMLQADLAGRAALIVALGLLPSLLIPYSSDLIESQIVTVVLADGNSSLFTRDLVMQSEKQFGSYSFFAGALALLPERTLYASLYVLWLWSWMGFALIFLWVHVKKFRSTSPALGCLAVLVGMGLSNYWDQWGGVILGDNDLIYPFMRHQTLALVLGLAGLFAAWQFRSVAAGVLIGLALNLHVNTGQHFLLVLGISWLIFDRRRFRSHAIVLGIALLTALPTLWPLVQIVLLSEPTLVRNPFIVVSGYFRHPNHLIPSSWTLDMYLRYAVLLAAGSVAWWMKREKSSFDYRLLLLMWCPVGFVAIGYVFVEIVPIDFVAKLQLSRMTLFTKVAAFLYLSLPLARIPLRFARRIPAANRLAVASAFAVLLMAAIGLGRHAVAAPTPSKLESYFLKHTPKDSLVLVPLDWRLKHFAARARRSVVVDLKRLPLGADADLVEYFERVCAVEGEDAVFTPKTAQRMRDNRERAYHELTPKQLAALHARYRFDFVVRRAEYSRPRNVKPVFAGNGYLVYAYRDLEDSSTRITQQTADNTSQAD